MAPRNDLDVSNDRRLTVLALLLAGTLWGTTVPLTKIAMTDIGPSWLTVLRFALAAAPLALFGRRSLRRAMSLPTVLWGGVGYGFAIVLQNAGIGRTSVSHGALIIGATPVLVAVFGVACGRGVARGATWGGLLLSLAGIGLITGDGKGEATLTGDLLITASTVLCAGFFVAQPRLLSGRNPVAVTGVQLASGALAALPFAVFGEQPPVDGTGGTVVAILALAVVGTLAPFTLFAYGQARVSPAEAGAYLNLEPLVGFVAGVALFGDTLAAPQIVGGLAVAGGILFSSAPPAYERTRLPAVVSDSREVRYR